MKLIKQGSSVLILIILFLPPHRVKMVSLVLRVTWESRETGYEPARKNKTKKAQDDDNNNNNANNYLEQEIGWFK